LRLVKVPENAIALATIALAVPADIFAIGGDIAAARKPPFVQPVYAWPQSGGLATVCFRYIAPKK
jgi:hypothetical protein